MKKSNGLRSIHPGGRYWLWYALPALFFYICFMAYPLLDSIRMSMFTGPLGQQTFVGLQNFRTLFSDGEHAQRYWNALGNTGVFFAIHMCVQNVLGIFFAVLLTQKFLRGHRLYQTIIFIPATLAVLITGYLWKLILNPIWAKGLWSAIGLPGVAQPWLGRESSALTTVSLVSCWQWVGIPTMMFVTALQNINEDLFEAADIAGANKWQAFWHIRFPLILPVVGIVAVLTFVSNFNAFDVIFAMENVNGAPAFTTDILGTLFYRVGIAGQHPVGIPNPGLGAAIATITFFLLLAGSLFALRLTRAKE